MKVFLVLGKWDFSYSGVFSTREKAEAYIEVRDKELQRLMRDKELQRLMGGGYPGSYTSPVTANLIIEEADLDSDTSGDWDEETLRELEEYPDDKPPLP